jgi:hypothetical protein
MVGNCVEVFVDMVFRGLNDVPLVEDWMFCFVEEH